MGNCGVLTLHRLAWAAQPAHWTQPDAGGGCWSREDGSGHVARRRRNGRSVHTATIATLNAARYGPAANGGQPSIKFMLLNPAVYFEEILLQSRAVILAGG